jgi:hypothetical protein
VELYDVLIESVGEELNNELKQTLVRRKVSYMADIFSRMNDANKELQGRGVTLVDAKRVIASLIQKLNLFRQNLARRSYPQFPLLHTAIQAFTEEPSDAELEVYTDHMRVLVSDLQVGNWVKCKLN